MKNKLIKFYKETFDEYNLMLKQNYIDMSCLELFSKNEMRDAFHSTMVLSTSDKKFYKQALYIDTFWYDSKNIVDIKNYKNYRSYKKLEHERNYSTIILDEKLYHICINYKKEFPALRIYNDIRQKIVYQDEFDMQEKMFDHNREKFYYKEYSTEVTYHIKFGSSLCDLTKEEFYELIDIFNNNIDNSNVKLIRSI